MREFVYVQPACRVIFGASSFDRLADEVKRLSASRAMVISTPEQRREGEEGARLLGGLGAGIFSQAVIHVPIETAQAAREIARHLKADCCVAIGGGSTIGLAKAIALESDLPILAVLTTFAGSEMTPIYCLTLISLFAAEGLRALARSLPLVVRETKNLEARGDALYGAWLAGMVLGAVSIGIYHKLCHTLGGSFNLPHAELHAGILPHAVAFNREAALEAVRIVAEALGVKEDAQGLYDLAVAIGAPVALRGIGMPAEGLEKGRRTGNPESCPNPRPVDYTGVLELLRNAYSGLRPA